MKKLQYLIFSCLFITISGNGPSVRESSGGFGLEYNHTNNSKIPIHGSNSTGGGHSVGESSGEFGHKYNHTYNSKITVHGSNCSIQSSNSTSTDSNTGSIMINKHKGTGAFNLFVTLTAIVLVIYLKVFTSAI
ncbi:hypothetical protein MKW92_050341 [Papaver armeniacum]|nr:hypothetical protein MKW92_050341 [Papaver armeniacum]